MGSLMSGWDSPVLDPKAAKYQRNKSYTRGEIEAFWKSQREREDGSSTESSPRPASEERVVFPGAGAKRYERSSSMPLPCRRSSSSLMEDKTAAVESEKITVQTTSCWWTRSNWAFLNEYPVIEPEEPPHSHKSLGAFHSSLKLGNHQRTSTS